MSAVDEEGFHEKLGRGRPVLGTVIATSDPMLAEFAADVSDFVWIDMEHSPLAPRDVAVLIIAARAGHAASLVRLPAHDSDLVTQVLDLGPDAIIWPRVDTAQQAAALAAATSYPPSGTRGMAQRRASSYGSSRSTDTHDDPLNFVQIESRQAVENSAAIARVAGVDGIIIGTADLALDAGCSLSTSDVVLMGLIDEVMASAAAADILCGVAIGGPLDGLIPLIERGTRVIAYSADVRIYTAALESALHEIAALLEAPPAGAAADSTPTPEKEGSP